MEIRIGIVKQIYLTIIVVGVLSYFTLTVHKSESVINNECTGSFYNFENSDVNDFLQFTTNKDTDTGNGTCSGAIHRPYKDKDKKNVTGKLCKFQPEKLKGRENITFDVLSFQEMEDRYNDSESGGRFRPQHCDSYDRIAVIIPYRDRSKHLKIFLNNMIPKLKRQEKDFTFYVIEQAPGFGFNRGMMRNVGFMEARKIANYSCYIFNDVDTVLEDDRNLYTCTVKTVRRLINGISRDHYRLNYSTFIGGVTAFTDEQFVTVNGYSNQFFVWDGEDDNLYQRIKDKKLKIERPKNTFGLYTTLGHTCDKKLIKRRNILEAMNRRGDLEGLNTLKYTTLFTEYRKLYTWIYVKVAVVEMNKNLLVTRFHKKKLSPGM